jgi:transposase
MDVHKHSTQTERLEVVETGRRRRWSDDEKLRIVLESLDTPRAISSTARRHGISRSLLMTWRRAFRPEPMGPDIQQTGFVRAMVATAETMAAEPGARASGRMVIEIGRRRRRCGRAGAGARHSGAAMIPVAAGVRIWIASGHTDMRKGMNGLALLVQEGLGRDPFAGDVFVFRGRAGSLIKALWHDGIGLSLYAKRLDRGRFVWPATVDGVVALSAAQMSYLLEAIDWRNPQHTWRPHSAG